MATTFQIALAGAGMAAGTFKGLVEDTVADAGESLTLEALINLGAAEPLTDAQWATKLVSNTIGGAAAANDEQAFIDAIAELAQQFSRGDLMVAYINLLDAVSVDDPVWGAAIQQWNNRLAVSEALDAALATEANTNAGDVALLQGLMAGVTANPATLNAALADVADAWIGGVNPNPTPVDPGTDGATIRLNLTESVYEGTANDDTFIAMPLGNTDTFMSGVMVDGGAGRDTLDITLGNFSNFAILAETTGVEVVSVRSQAVNTNGNNGDNEVGDSNIISGARNVIDAELMEGVQEWWSSNSRSDLIVEDVRSNSHQTTVGFRSADAGDVDYAVYFDNQFITAADPSAAGATLFLRLLDLDGMRTDGEPLLNNPYNGFSFMLDGVRKVLQSDGILEATTFAELRDAINAALAEDPSLADLQASLGMDYTAINSDTGVSYVGTEIVITNSGSGVLATGSWLTPTGEAPADTNILARQSNEQPDVIEPLTSVNIVLDNVGRGSKSGDLEIGAMSQSDYSGSRGIEQFDIEVDRSSWIDTLQSTNNTLEVVNVENIGANGNLRIDQLQDVRVFNAEAMQGDVVLTADLSASVVGKYMLLSDDQDAPAADNVAFNYSTGNGDDTLNLTIDAANLANDTFVPDVGTTTREDFDLNIATGSGDDNVTLSIVSNGALASANGGSANWYQNSVLNNNLQLNTGAGNDTIRTPGSGDMNINAGSGNDTIYVDNTGDYGITGRMATFVFNQTTSLTNPLSDANDTYSIYNGTLTISFKGFEATVDLPHTNGVVSDLQVNQAIKAAINNDPVLSTLIVAKDSAANGLVIESLIDGVIALDELAVSIAAPDELTPAEQAEANQFFGTGALTAEQLIDLMELQIDAFNLKGDYATTYATLGMAAYTGVNSTHTSDNVILPGTGDDVVVLGTGANSNDTVVYEDYLNGTDTIVNFVAGVLDETTVPADNPVSVEVTTQGTAGNAPADEVAATFELKVSAASADGNVVFTDEDVFGDLDGTAGVVDLSVAVLAADDAAAVAGKIVAAWPATSDWTVAVDPEDPSTIVFTEATPTGTTTPVQTDILAAVDGSSSGVLATVENITIGSFGTPEVLPATEVITVTFGQPTIDGLFQFDGDEFPILENDTAQDVANTFAAGDFASWTAAAPADNGDGTWSVELTSTTANAEVADVTIADFTGDINLNAEVITDWVVAPGSDMLDFSAYDVTGVEVGTMVGGTFNSDEAFYGAWVEGDEYVFLVESAENAGEYQMLHVEATGVNTYQTLGIIGTADFGQSMNFVEENFII
ncbi:MAG: hypothetical protein WCY08_00885 [Rhodocyclaceae bacterium]